MRLENMKFASAILALLLVSLCGCVMVPTYPSGIGNVAPGAVNPNGVVKGSPGQTYFNKSNNTFWEKSTGRDSVDGWVQLF